MKLYSIEQAMAKGSVSMESAYTIPPELSERLRAAHSVVVFTGAGISAESGIPTFRDASTGLWGQYNPKDLATPQGFERNPRLVWEWYRSRRSLATQVAPNPGHQALAALERFIPTVTVITQNVDGLHQRAGSTRVIELHGSLHRVKCSREGLNVETWEESETLPPRCPRCQAFLRPDVVWFGEPLPQQPLKDAVAATEACDVLFSIGTSGQIYPAASLVHVARRAGATIVIMNPDEKAQAVSAFYRLTGPSGQVLPTLLQAVWPEREIP